MGKIKRVLAGCLASAMLLSVNAFAADLNVSGTVTGSTVNVRVSPSLGASVVTKLKKDTAVTVVDAENGWYKITSGDTSGYMASEYVHTSSTIVYVSGSSVNFRSSGEITDGNVICTLKEGTPVILLEEGAEWTKVQYNGQAGYMASEYLSEKYMPETTEDKSAVIAYAKTLLGTPYKYGGSSPNGFDCSGFTQYVYKKFGVALSHSSAAQYQTCANKVSRDALSAGDLVFFTTRGKSIGHVGIYVGDNKFIHAPSAGKVVEITTMGSGYYNTRYVGAAKVL